MYTWTEPSESEAKFMYTSTYQGWVRTQKYAQNCTALVIRTWPTMLDKTFLDTRLAVGPFGKMRG